MRCPFCQHDDTRVIDSRLNIETNQIRRRRECPACTQRFNTLESMELELPYIIKRDGRRIPFDVQKLRTGMLRALEKRPVAMEQVETIVQKLIQRLHNCGEREIASRTIGEWVMESLRHVDPVAYVRFASVYRQFEDVDAFRAEVQRLKKQRKEEKSEDTSF